ncbi:hypothetical protein N9478_10325 [Gammaproteobacteria bacterium]|nr:hypothetical protein [Gammaproteobacteria bacterium]
MSNTSVFEDINRTKLRNSDPIRLRIDVYRLDPILTQIDISLLKANEDIAFIFAYFQGPMRGETHLVIEIYIANSRVNNFDKQFSDPYNCFIRIDPSVEYPHESSLKRKFRPAKSLRDPMKFIDLPNLMPLIIRVAGTDSSDADFNWNKVVIGTINDLLLIREPYEESDLFRFNEVYMFDSNFNPRQILVKNNHWLIDRIVRKKWTPKNGHFALPKLLEHRLGVYDTDSNYIECPECKKIQFLENAQSSDSECRACGFRINT